MSTPFEPLEPPAPYLYEDPPIRDGELAMHAVNIAADMQLNSIELVEAARRIYRFLKNPNAVS